MRKIRTALAAMLVISASVAFESAADAQARRTESASRSVTRTTPKTSKSSAKSVSGQNVKRNAATVNRNTSTARPSTATRPAAGSRPAAVERKEPNRTTVKTAPARKVVKDNKPSTTVSRPVADKPVSVTRKETRPGNQTVVRNNPAFDKGNQNKPVTVSRPGNRTDRPDRPEARPGDRPGHKPDKPVQIRPDHRPEVHRVHPRERDFMPYDRPSRFWSGHNHCFGHRVRVLPVHVRRHVHFGVTYYCYNDIWYRPYGGYYVVCRPPFGTVLAAELIADMAWTAVRLSYYHTVANTYRSINENNEYIARQNEIIAGNNALIAAQNQTIAMNGQLASAACSLANELGLVQSFADAGSSYFYQDGVFYSMGADGEYKVIVPPSGALVESLPDDYDMVILNGDEYYKVDDTVYKVTISEGKPYFEVLGQLYS